MAPKGFSVEMLKNKYSGKRFGSWIVGDEFFRENRVWQCKVTCDCGKSWNVTLASLAVHGKCSCRYLEKVVENKHKTYKKTALEEIWPAVIKAGRTVMEKHGYAMA